MNGKSVSLFRRRVQKFKSLKRGYYSFWLLILLYAFSWVLPLVCNNQAIMVSYKGEWTFPFLTFHSGQEYGLESAGEPNWRYLDKKFQKEGGENWVLMPLYPYGPHEQLVDMKLEASLDPDDPAVLSVAGSVPHAPSWEHPLGTDKGGIDLVAMLAWGFRVSLSFALMVILVTYAVGVAVGAFLGYFGGLFDILCQRLVEILSALPFLYFIMIFRTSFKVDDPLWAFFILVGIMCIFGWIGITYYIRGEFYREKGKEYVAAAVSQGQSHLKIIFTQILPNAITPIVTFAPFAIVGAISALVSLDFLGFGLPPGTPSWGAVVRQGTEEISSGKWWLIVYPLSVMFSTLMMIVFVGEATREAFDPKVFSRLR